MSPRVTTAVATRVLRQLRHDRRTTAMLFVLPCLLITLLWWVFDGDGAVFNRIGAPLLAVFPFIVMFLVTSVTTLSERTSGTLERLLAMPMSKLDLLGGYAVAFGAVAVVQGIVTTTLAVAVLGLDVAGAAWVLAAIAVLDGVLGTALGLFVSAFARTEFQAVQFMPAFVLPQLLVCGLLLPRDAMPDALGVVSDALPLSYAVDAMQQVSVHAGWTGELTLDVTLLVAFVLAALLLGAATLRRRTP